ncbi:MAG TPA: hypothetical protein VMV03_00620, partial [Spirochaetia bacterium]|nr:hypothetical protein [Spirochaetia bacterium]
MSEAFASAVPPGALHVCLLGGFRVSIGKRTLGAEQWRRRKAAHLVKLLALSPGHSLHREQVIDLLWPDLEPGAAVNSLHQTLHVARGALGAGARARGYLSLKEDIIHLGAEGTLWIDVDAFQAAAAAA